MHLPKSETEVVGALEAALNLAAEAEAIEAKIRAAAKNSSLHAASAEGLADAALAAHIIDAAEHAVLTRFTTLRNQVIAVDDFPRDFGRAEVAARQGAAA